VVIHAQMYITSPRSGRLSYLVMLSSSFSSNSLQLAARHSALVIACVEIINIEQGMVLSERSLIIMHDLICVQYLRKCLIAIKLSQRL